MCDFDRYEEIIQRIKSYYGTSFNEELFLQGGCYWLAEYLHNHLTYSFIMMNKEKEHCAIEIQNELYDITGKIKPTHYVWANDRNIAYMRKYYRPKFDAGKLEAYLNDCIDIKKKEQA